LPGWFSRLHPNYKTPINSILFVGAVTLVIGLASLTGVHAHEAFQLIDNAGGVFYALTYLVLFAIPLFGMKALGVRAPWWLKIACASGFIVTLIYIRFAIAPITEVEDLRSFALKIISTVVLANAIGLGIYVLRKRK
jgi:amino acid transporter